MFCLQETIVHEFEVCHKNVRIGTVKVAEKGPTSTCLKIIQKSGNPEIIVRSLKLGDFVVSKHSELGHLTILSRNISIYFRRAHIQKKKFLLYSGHKCLPVFSCNIESRINWLLWIAL